MPCLLFLHLGKPDMRKLPYALSMNFARYTHDTDPYKPLTT